MVFGENMNKEDRRRVVKTHTHMHAHALLSWPSNETNGEVEVLECLSEVHKVISLSQRAFNMEGSGGKAMGFYIKTKVPDTLSLLWL